MLSAERTVPGMPDADDIARIESKVDRLTQAVEKLVLIEERQTTQGQRIGALEQRVATAEAAITATDRKLEQWLNRAWGVYVVAAAVGAVASKVLLR